MLDCSCRVCPVSLSFRLHCRLLCYACQFCCLDIYVELVLSQYVLSFPSLCLSSFFFFVYCVDFVFSLVCCMLSVIVVEVFFLFSVCVERWLSSVCLLDAFC